jgi:peptidase U32-like protein
VRIREFLASQGLPAGDLGELPTSAKRFPDGAWYRVEIPSTEGPAAFAAVLDAAARFDVPVHRVSQGTGVALLTEDELEQMASLGARERVEVSLFARPNAGWGASASARAPAGGALAAAAWGVEQVVQQLEEIRRAAALGFRSVLIADIGVLRLFSALRDAGELPADMQAKISVMLPAANAAAARVLEELGASTLNVPVDLSLAQLAAIRAAVDIPLDVYVESPDNLGGIVRLHEIAEIVRVAAPVHVKFGLRNAPDLYPSGSHLEATAVALSAERVRRARLGLDLLRRAEGPWTTSELGAAGLAVPEVAGAPVSSAGRPAGRR